MTTCKLCGHPQAARCEGGQVEYVSGWFPCALKVGVQAGEPLPVLCPAVRQDAPDDLWTIEPEPSAAGLEDLL